MPMAEPLQKKALFRTLHIALFFFVIFITKNSYAQTLLLPGDVVFVSVNSSSNEFELVSLIELESGTEFSINNGVWNNSEQTFTDGDEINVFVQKKIEAGTPIKFNAEPNDQVLINGSINLSQEREQLFIYQKDKEQFRFLYALGWGDKDGKKDRSFFGSDLPEVLNENKNTVLKLGSNNNYQYYIRNGASGTKKMLLTFISNAGFWRGNDEAGFPGFGTSFNLLAPPVILFDESLTAVKENRKQTSLNVAIYEHDGSKLTVDVAFDSVSSSLMRDEIDGFSSQTINFTGLIGDAVYEIEVPLKDDNDYEGLESGIFSLQNLSSGRFGDFITHTVLVSDDEIPEVKLELSEDHGDDILLIHNLESKEIDLKNWELENKDARIIFPRNTMLGVGETLVVFNSIKNDSEIVSNSYGISDEEDLKIFASGLIQLKNDGNEKVAEIEILKKEKNESQNLISDNRVNTSNTGNESSNITEQRRNNVETTNPGWKALFKSEISIDDFASTEFYYWDVNELRFRIYENAGSEVNDHLLIGYFDKDASEKLQKLKSKNTDSAKSLNLSIKSLDLDENGLIQSTEGLNLVKNNTSVANSAQKLINVLQAKLEQVENISVYKSSTNFEKITKVDADAMIFSGDLFWLKFNSEFSEQDLSINVEELKNPVVEQEKIEKGVLELELKSKSTSSNLVVTFIPEEAFPDNSLNFKLNKELYLSNLTETVLATNVSNNRYDAFEINVNSGNITSLPIEIVSPVSGELELKVNEWGDIPEGWVIMIEDLKEDKSYEIHENWSLKFNYSNVSATNEDKVMLPSIDDRFTLKVIPKELVVKEEEELPSNVELHQNYPNPFNPTTVISFYMPEEGLVKLSVFNIVGQPVAVLLNETRARGAHSYEWDASDMPSGIYIYQLEVGTKIMTRKMTLVK